MYKLENKNVQSVVFLIINSTNKHFPFRLFKILTSAILATNSITKVPVCASLTIGTSSIVDADLTGSCVGVTTSWVTYIDIIVALAHSAASPNLVRVAPVTKITAGI